MYLQGGSTRTRYFRFSAQVIDNLEIQFETFSFVFVFFFCLLFLYFRFTGTSSVELLLA